MNFRSSLKIALSGFLCFLMVACRQGSDSPTPPMRQNPSSPVGEKRPGESTGQAPGSAEFVLQGQETTAPNGEQPLDSLGFYPARSPLLPEAVRTAAESVFELRVTATTDEKFRRSVDLVDTNADGSVTIKAIEALSAKNFDSKDKLILKRTIKDCVDRKLNKCTLNFQIRKSSGFLLESDRKLVTNAHVVAPFIDEVKKYDGKTEEDILSGAFPIRVFIFNQKGELVFDPYEQMAAVHVRPPSSRAATETKKFYEMDSDMITLALSQPIGKPLKARVHTAEVGEKVFVLGFPSCTNCLAAGTGQNNLDVMDRGQGLNAEGGVLKISIGHRLGFERADQLLGGLGQLRQIYDQNQMVFYSADSQYGSSGGPVISAKGEVLAVHSGGRTFDDNGHYRRISRGVRSPSWK